MSATQVNPNVAIETPLGEGRVRLVSATITEGLGRLFQMEVELFSDEPDIPFESIVGDNFTICLTLPDGRSYRYFNGFVSRFVQTSTDQTGDRYRAVLVPWLWFLTRTADCRIFQNQSVPDIIKEVFRDHGFTDFEDKLTGNYAPREYCVQYSETDFNFVSRLMEHEGIYYFFTHENGKHTLILADSASAHESFPGYDTVPFHTHRGQHGQEAIQSWTLEQEVQPGTYMLNDFNFEKPRTSLLSRSDIASPHAQSSYEFYEYPGRYSEQDQGSEYSKIRIEELHTRHETHSGQGNVRGIAAGCTFGLEPAPRADQKCQYLVTDATCYLSGDRRSDTSGDGDFYACAFRAINVEKPFRAARLAFKPRIQGPQTAIVVGPQGEEIHTDQYGRIKVQFHWDRQGKADEDSSCWVRVSQAAWAGKKWGALHIPRVGQEVIVEFLEGDPDQPIVTGQVYNAGAMPPYDLPANKTRTTLKSRSSKGGGGFNELRFEDKKGGEQIFIHAERNYDLNVKASSIESVGGEKHLTVGSDRFEKIDGDQHVKIAGEHNQSVGETFSLGAGQNIQLKAGQNFGVDAGTEVYLKAGTNVVIEAGSMLTLSVGGSFITIDSGGVYIQGPAVMIASGGPRCMGSPVILTSPKPAKAADDDTFGEATDTDNTPATPSKDPLDSKPVQGPAATALANAAARGLPFCEVCEAALPSQKKPAATTPDPEDGSDDVDPDQPDSPDDNESSDDVDPPGPDDDGGDFRDDVDPPPSSKVDNNGQTPPEPPASHDGGGGDENSPRGTDNNTPPEPPPAPETPPPLPGNYQGGGGESGGGGSSDSW